MLMEDAEEEEWRPEEALRQLPGLTGADLFRLTSANLPEGRPIYQHIHHLPVPSPTSPRAAPYTSTYTTSRYRPLPL